jgi:methanogenic corrinoid protein MtbC1
MAGFPSLLEGAFSGWSSLDATIQREFARTRSRLKLAPTPPRRDASEQDLASLVEGEIIPRLMLAHGGALDTDVGGAPAANPSGDDFEEVLRLCLGPDPDGLMPFLDALTREGLNLEAVYVELLIPAARRLGALWEDDVVSFTDVTIGLGRLQQAVRLLGSHGETHGQDVDSRSALFAPAPGEQHTFGLFLVEDQFRRAGWRTWMEPSASTEDCRDLASGQWFDLVGLSASPAADVSDLTSAITRLRALSRNPDLVVMVGGALFIENPVLISEVGADASALTAAEALLIANNCIRRPHSAY